jgi:hypothetical protein
MKSKETLRIVIMLMAVAAIPMAVSLLAQGVLQDSTCGVPVTDPCAQQLCPSLPPPPNNQYIGHPCGKIFGLSGTYCIGGSQGATCNWDRQDPAAVYLGGCVVAQPGGNPCLCQPDGTEPYYMLFYHCTVGGGG